MFSALTFSEVPWHHESQRCAAQDSVKTSAFPECLSDETWDSASECVCFIRKVFALEMIPARFKAAFALSRGASHGNLPYLIYARSLRRTLTAMLIKYVPNRRYLNTLFLILYRIACNYMIRKGYDKVEIVTWHCTDDQFTTSEFVGVVAKTNTFVMSSKLHGMCPKCSCKPENML